MGVHIGENKFLITAEHKIFYFNLTKNVNNNLKRETHSIIKHNEILVTHIINNNIR